MDDIWKMREKEKVCILDLDDTLAESIPYWVNWINEKKGTHYKTLDEAKDFLRYREYKNLKAEFRSSGAKANILPKPYASEFTKELHKMDYQIIIVTRRPFSMHKNLFKLTKNWLEKNDIEYDGLIFEDKKHLKILSEFENISFAVEDNRYIANIFGNLGIKCYLLDNLYNQGSLKERTKRVFGLEEILEDLHNG